MPNVLSDKQSRNTILLGTLSLSIAGATFGGCYAVLRYIRPVRKPVISMAVSWGVAGLMFFTARQTLLIEEHRQNSAYDIKPSQTKDSDEAFSSSAAGVLTGGLLGGATGGKKGALAGMLILGTVSYAFQKGYTKVYRYRQKVIMEQMGLGQVAVEEPEEHEPNSYARRLRRLARIDIFPDAPKWFPIKTISHEEYMQILDIRQEEIVVRLNEIDAELGWIEKNLKDDSARP